MKHGILETKTLSKLHILNICLNFECFRYAKPLVIKMDHSDGIYQVMYDDHCHKDDDCIINVIDYDTEADISYNDHIGKYTMQADSYQAIYDEDYYVKSIMEMYELQKSEVS